MAREPSTETFFAYVILTMADRNLRAIRWSDLRRYCEDSDVLLKGSVMGEAMEVYSRQAKPADVS